MANFIKKAPINSDGITHGGVFNDVCFLFFEDEPNTVVADTKDAHLTTEQWFNDFKSWMKKEAA